jgi:hypothetical protein
MRLRECYDDEQGEETVESPSTGQDGSHSLMDRPVTDFFSWVCGKNCGIKSVRFATYRPAPKLSERLRNILTSDEQALRDQATLISHETGIPFWDALLGISMKKDGTPNRFLEAAAAHSADAPERVVDLSSEEVSHLRIRSVLSELLDGQGLVVSSRVPLKAGGWGHIPMLDFRCPCSAANAGAIRQILSLLGQNSGILAESGRSYHFYGARLLSPSDWVHFMGRALLFAPLADPRYVAHRLADGECRLKIAASRNAPIPKIVDVYTEDNLERDRDL